MKHATRLYGLLLADVRDPLEPLFIGKLEIDDQAMGVACDSGLAFVADFRKGMKVVDLRDAARPALVGRVATPDRALGVDTTDRYAFVTGHAGPPPHDGWLQVVDIVHPDKPMVVGELATGSPPRDVEHTGGLLYLVNESHGLEVIDVGDPLQPSLLGSVDTDGEAFAVVSAGDHAYVADGYEGLQIIDVSDAAKPERVGHLGVPGRARGIDYADGYVYLAAEDRGLHIVDVHEPGHPVLVGTALTSGHARDVVCLAGLAYVAAYDGGLEVIDVRDPLRPTLVGSRHTSGPACSLAVAEEVVYLAVEDQGVVVVDVRDPARPTLAGRVVMSGRALGVSHAVTGLTFVAAAWAGLQVIQTNPPLADLEAPTSGTITATVQRGCTPGPYNVRVMQPEEEEAELHKGFRLCTRRALEFELEPLGTPTPPQITLESLLWRVSVTGDYLFLLPEPIHRGQLLLPELPENLVLTYVPAGEPCRDTIELDLLPSLDRGEIRLIGADRLALMELWDTIHAGGGVSLPRIDDHTYGDIELTLQRSPAAGQPAVSVLGGHGGSVITRLAPIVYRYEFRDGRLIAARAWGQNVDHLFHGKAIYDWTCEVEDRVSYVETVTALCEGFAAEHPDLVVDCTF